MICVKDIAMNVVHLSLEWYGFTGIGEGDALVRGWLRAVHADDRAVVDDILDAAARNRSGYSLVYRLLHRDGASIWVSDGALPSFAPDDHRFIGLLGSITEIASEASMIAAHGSLGTFHPPPPMPSTLTSVRKDLMADYLLLARSLADREGERAIVEAMDFALYLTRKRLDRTSH